MATVQKPLLEVLQGGPAPEHVMERVIGYGPPGVGKTRWGLSLPERFGKIAYFAADNNSHLLASISRKKRERIYVVRPVGDNPTATFMAFCMRDWTKVDPAIKTLVVDTFSKVGWDALTWSANTGSVDREKHFVVGTPGEGGQAIPNRGDYQGLDSVGKGWLDMLAQRQADMHIIFLCHEEVKVIDGFKARGGPSFPGSKFTEYLPGQFNTVIRLVREQQLVKGADMPEDVVVAVGEGDGKYVAKVRTEDETQKNVMARVVCNRDPLNWWTAYDASLGIKENN
jgi:hypothetical protein